MHHFNSDVRTLFVAFVLSLLRNGDTSVVVRVAEQKGILSSILKTLKDDSLEVCVL